MGFAVLTLPHMSSTDDIRRIKAALRMQGLTQKDLAGKLGKKPSEVSRWLSGRMGISDANLQRIEQVLGTEGTSSSVLQPSAPLRIGIIGTGSIAMRFASEAAHVDTVTIAAAFNPDPAECAMFCDRFGIPCAARTPAQLIEASDAVYVASPLSTHFEYSKMALEAGRHVLCEMPFTATRAQASELFRLAARKRLAIVPALKTAFCPSFQKLVEIAQGGAIGDVSDISATVTTMLPDSSSLEFNDERILENATYPILVAFKLLGTGYRKLISTSRRSASAQDGRTIFNHSALIYDGVVATFKVGTGVKSEGSLVISGTRGYIYVPAPWWRTDYFELRFENPAENRKFYFPFEQAGLRYEIASFTKAVKSSFPDPAGLTREETLRMIEIQTQLI